MERLMDQSSWWRFQICISKNLSKVQGVGNQQEDHGQARLTHMCSEGKTLQGKTRDELLQLKLLKKLMMEYTVYQSLLGIGNPRCSTVREPMKPDQHQHTWYVSIRSG
ncbi:hypothetical protein AMECASPLE_035553 [Ameca splendens]|uniref:Uncharacterized protein n=1 Tax=Ameca splendens TaxID=208324 RepID=A0ABV0ZIM7_9TELE